MSSVVVGRSACPDADRSPKRREHHGYVYESLRLAFPYGYRGARLVAVLTAYLDASANHQAVTVSGYISDTRKWATFSREWDKSLSIYGIKESVGYFHMTDFMAAKRAPYRSWSEEQRASRLRKLVGIINASVLASISVTIPLELYESALSAEEKARAGNAYALAALGCFKEATRWLRSHGGPVDEIAYVYDQGDDGRGEVFKVFNFIYDDTELRGHHRLLSMRVEDKKRFLPLQAADLVAWELNLEAMRLRRLGKEPPRAEMAIIDRCPARYWGFANTRDHLRSLTTIFSDLNLKGGRGWNTMNPIGSDD